MHLARTVQWTDRATPKDPSVSSATPTPTAHWSLVALGDSTARANVCDGCTTTSTSTRRPSRGGRVPVLVDNRAAIKHLNVPALQATQLLSHLLTDESLRDAVATADIVVVAVGYQRHSLEPARRSLRRRTSLPSRRLGEAHRCLHPQGHGDYKQTLNEILTQIDELRGCGEMPDVPPCSQRGNEDTLIRVVTVYNAAIGDPSTLVGTRHRSSAHQARQRSIREGECEIVRFHGGKCADLYHVMNGPTGTRSAGPYLSDWAHLNQRGHRLVANVLIKLGLAPPGVLMPRQTG